VAHLYAKPVHFRARGARGWNRIDSGLRRVGGRWVNRANRYRVALPDEIARVPVRVRRDGLWVQFALRGARGTARVRGTEAVYRGALPGVDISYRAQASSVKETLTLDGPRAQRRFVFDLSVAPGLRPRVLKGRGLVVRDRRGRTRMALAAPWMVDARGSKTGRVGLSLASVGGRWRLTMTPSRRWLARPVRAWPVTVDPYVYTEPDQDCQLDENTPATSWCAADALAVGATTAQGTTGPLRHATVLRFPGVKDIPAQAEVNWASVKLFVKRVEAPNWVKLPGRPLTQPWTGQATWNHADGVDRWSEPGGEADDKPDADADGKSDDDADYGGAWIGSTSTESYWHVKKLVGEWVKGRRANHGMLITAPVGTYAEFHPTEVAGDTSSSTAQGHEPRLEVAYSERTGRKRAWMFEQLRLSDRITMGVNVASGNLLLQQNDLAIAGGLGPDVSVSRSYNSLEREASRQGLRWRLDTGHDVGLENWGSSMVYRGAQGTSYAFRSKGDDSGWDVQPQLNASLSNDPGGEHTLTFNESQAKQHFGSSGRLLWSEDRNGRRLTFDYASSGARRVTAIKDANGDTKATFTYDAALNLDKVTDPSGRVYDYTVDASGALTAYADPESGTANPTRYEYNNDCGKLSKLTTPQGRVTLVTYYPSGGQTSCRVKTITRVTNATAMTGPTHDSAYTFDRDGSGHTDVTDPNGSATLDADDRVWRSTFDDQGRVTKTRDPLGRESSRKLTSTSNVESYTSAGNGGTTPNTTLGYDADDNATKSDTPAGAGAGSILGAP